MPMLDGEPLFGCYLFAKLPELETVRVSPLMWLPPIYETPDWLVEQFKSTEWTRSEDCAEGSKVRITNGAFQHMEAIVKTKQRDRIIVLMNIINQEQELSFPLKDVIAA